MKTSNTRDLTIKLDWRFGLVERRAQVHLNELMAFHRQTKEHFDDAMRAWHAETEGLTEEQESMDADYLIDRRDSIESLMDSSIEGRKKSSQNALRHGVTAQTTVMNEVDRNFHDVFCADIVAEFNPVGAMETFLASSIAEEAWRLNHSRAQCDNIIAIGQFDGTGDRFDTEHPEIHAAITAAGTTRDNAITLELLSLYRQRIHRAFEISPDIKPDWLVFAETGVALGGGAPAFSAREILREIAGAVPTYAAMTPKGLGDTGLRWSYPESARPAPSIVPVADPV